MKRLEGQDFLVSCVLLVVRPDKVRQRVNPSKSLIGVKEFVEAGFKSTIKLLSQTGFDILLGDIVAGAYQSKVRLTRATGVFQLSIRTNVIRYTTSISTTIYFLKSRNNVYRALRFQWLCKGKAGMTINNAENVFIAFSLV